MKIKLLTTIVFLLIIAGYADGTNQALSASPSDSAYQPSPAQTDPESVPVSFKISEAPTESPSDPSDSGNDDNDRISIAKDKSDAAPDGAIADSSAAGSDAAAEKSDMEDNVPADETGDQETPDISDPLEPFNRAMYHFNDKVYFWVLKPAAQGYKAVVPEVARVSVGNFFSNAAFPVRFVNCLLQANFRGAATELGRFVMNTIWGIGGLLDPAASGKIDLQKYKKDFGQTLGIYGLGPGFYIIWPFLGPSSARDTVGLVGDYALSPFTYVSPWEWALGVRSYDEVNDVSLKIGDYESLKEAAIDPYVAMRNAYFQYRQKKIKERGLMPETPKPKGLSYLRDNERVSHLETHGQMAGD